MGFNAPTNTFDTFADLRKFIGQSSSSVTVLGKQTIQDQGGGTFYWDASSTEPDDGQNVVQPLSIVVGRWKRSNTYSLQTVTDNNYNETSNSIYITGRGGFLSPNPGLGLFTNNPLTQGIIQWKTGSSISFADKGFVLRNEDGGTITLSANSDLGEYIESSVPIKAPDAIDDSDLVTLSQLNSASDALNLQEVTNNGNVTSNAIHVIAPDGYDINQNGAALIGNSDFVGLYFNNGGITINQMVFLLQTLVTAGAQFTSRVSGQDGINPYDFATLNQVQSYSLPIETYPEYTDVSTTGPNAIIFVDDDNSPSGDNTESQFFRQNNKLFYIATVEQ